MKIIDAIPFAAILGAAAKAEPLWGVWCIRHASSRLGADAAWAKVDGKIFAGTQAQATQLATDWSASGNRNLTYVARAL